MLPSYGKVYNFGKPEVRDIFSGPVVIQEKVDGSQFSFGVVNGSVICCSRTQNISNVVGDSMFAAGVAAAYTACHRVDIEGFVFRGEYLRRPKHNVLAYDRTPTNHIILFDGTVNNQPLTRQTLEAYAKEMGFEVVPEFQTNVTNRAELEKLLETKSVLGGQLIEGIVVKNYAMMDPQGHGCLKAKYVAPRFREIANSKGKSKLPGQHWLDEITSKYTGEARYHKAVQHLRDAGKLQEDVKDIGPLMKEFVSDLWEECAEQIKEEVFRYAWKEIARRTSAGLPQWYKDHLAAKQFGGE